MDKLSEEKCILMECHSVLSIEDVNEIYKQRSLLNLQDSPFLMEIIKEIISVLKKNGCSFGHAKEVLTAVNVSSYDML